MDFSSQIARATRERLSARFGPSVERWWDELPELVAELAARWELSLDEAYARGNTSLVIRCRRADGRSAVLKLTPERALAVAEASALGRWSASGRVPLVLAQDGASGALLLEAIPNETPLSDLDAPIDLDEVTNLIGALHRAGAAVVGDGVVPLAERVEFIFGHWAERHPSAPPDRIRQGRELARRLATDASVPVLLHGDLHSGNVLDGGAARGLVAIDPRPCVGDPAFDAVDWVFWGVDDPCELGPRCRKLGVALGVDPERLWAWCTAFEALLTPTGR